MCIDDYVCNIQMCVEIYTQTQAEVCCGKYINERERERECVFVLVCAHACVYVCFCVETEIFCLLYIFKFLKGALALCTFKILYM